MMRRILFVISLLALSLLTTPAFASIDVEPSAMGSGAAQDGKTHVDVRLVTDFEAVKPGDTLRVGILFDLVEAWHIYWENPGDAGLPTNIGWESEGLEFGPLQWSAPGVYPEDELITFGYDHQVILYSEATVRDDVSDTIEIGASIEYLACHNACLPGEHALTTTLPVAQTSRHAPAEVRALFDEYSLQVPQDAEALNIIARTTVVDEKQALLEVVLCEGPDESCPADAEITYQDLEYAFVTTAASDLRARVLSIDPHPTVFKGWVLSLATNKALSDEEMTLSGVFRIDDGEGSIIPVHIETLVEEGDPDLAALIKASSSDSQNKDTPHLAYVLLLAFLGGMILNLMPCVFPVLAIKVASFTEVAQKDRGAILAHGAAYTAGITGSLLLLGAVVAGLQMAGTQVGWGFQFQQPLFLAALALIIVLFALNSFDIFQVTLRSGGLDKATDRASGVKRSFAEGVLAVVLATPCSAPFLGTAMGFALTAHPAIILLIFFVLGLGLAAPFVVLTMVPGATRVLPRPGAWMSHLKSFLGFTLLGVAIWLVWLVGRLAGVDAMGRLLGLLGTVSVSIWIYGLVQFRPWTRSKNLALGAALAILVGGVALFYPLEDPNAVYENTAGSGPVDWQPWDKDAIAEELEAGRKVFVNFTADWCLTCKTNERTTIHDRDVIQAINEGDIAMFKADWTRPDESIRQELEAHNRGGVPMYLFYTPEAPEDPEVLPELLTPRTLLDRF